MKGIQEELSLLISLTQLHLLQEHDKGEWFITDQKTYESFRAFALRDRPQKTPQSTQQTLNKNIVPPLPAQKSQPPKQATLKETKNTEAKKPEKPTLKVRKADDNKSAKPKLSFEKQKVPVPPVDDFNDIRKMVSKLFPNQTILDETPDEQSLKVQLVPEVIVLLDEESPQHLEFIANLAKAIQLCLCPVAALSTKDKGSNNQLKPGDIKMLIGKDEHLQRVSQQYPEAFALPLSTIDGYLQNPESKAELWDMICKEYKQRSN